MNVIDWHCYIPESTSLDRDNIFCMTLQGFSIIAPNCGNSLNSWKMDVLLILSLTDITAERFPA